MARSARTWSSPTQGRLACPRTSMPPSLSLKILVERWPIAGTFTISRGSRPRRMVVVAELSDGRLYSRPRRVRSLCALRRNGGRRRGDPARDGAGVFGARARPCRPADDASPGAARNALDCALWDLAAERAGRRRTRKALARGWRAAAAHHRLHDFAWPARGHGRRGRRGRGSSASQDQARRRRRQRAHSCGPRRSAPGRVDRRRQRGLGRGRTRRQFRRLRRPGVTMIEQPVPIGGDGALAGPSADPWAPTKACTTAPRSPHSSANTTPSTSSSTSAAVSPRPGLAAEADGHQNDLGKRSSQT